MKMSIFEALEIIHTHPKYRFIPCDSSGKSNIDNWQTRASREPRQIREWLATFPEMSLAIVTGDTTYEICPIKEPTTTPSEAPTEIIAEVVPPAAASPPTVIPAVVVPAEDKPPKRPRKRIEDNVMRYRRRYKAAVREEFITRGFSKSQSFEREALKDTAWERGGYLPLDYRFLAAEAFVNVADVAEFAKFKKQLRSIILYDFVEIKEPDGTKVLFSQTLADDNARADKEYEREQKIRSKGGFTTAERKANQ